MSYKKVRTVFINDKKKVIYMKPKGTREYVKSKGEMVLLTSYLKKVEKVAAKKAMASKLAKKSPKVKRSTKSVRRGGFFFATEEPREKEKDITGRLTITSPNSVGIGGTGSNPEQQTITTSQSMPSQPMPSQQMSQPMTGGYYNAGINNAEIIQTAKNVVDQLFNSVQLKGGKKTKRGKRVVKKETNPFKNFMNTLALKKKQRKGKKRGGYNEDGDLPEVY
jgi:hypothetical protein